MIPWEVLLDSVIEDDEREMHRKFAMRFVAFRSIGSRLVVRER